MLTDKELKCLESLEKNQEVIYLLNSEECQFVSRLIRSYKDLKRQLTAIRIKEKGGWSITQDDLDD